MKQSTRRLTFALVAIAGLCTSVAIVLSVTRVDLEMLSPQGPDIMSVSSDGSLGRVTGFPVPRFVSLASNRARMRVGPGFQYDIEWVYVRAGLPLEILAEYGNWRQVRDHDGTVGWMHQSLLSGNRTAIVAPWSNELTELKAGRSSRSRVIARMEPGLQVELDSCGRDWCELSVQGSDLGGYAQRGDLWGVYARSEVPTSLPQDDR